jgi:hypothetical protein
MIPRWQGANKTGWGIVALLLSLTPLAAQAQTYALDWQTIGGGGTSTGGVYSVSGTIGQPDAGTMNGGAYSLTGGFWGLIAVVQTPVTPALTITGTNGAVTVSWPNPSPGWVLDMSTTLVGSPPPWNQVPPAQYHTNATDISVTVSPPVGSAFYRLRKPQ